MTDYQIGIWVSLAIAVVVALLAHRLFTPTAKEHAIHTFNKTGQLPVPSAKSPQQVQVLPANADRIVLSYPGFMTVDQRKHMREAFNACVERGDKVLLLEGGINLVAVFAAQVDAVGTIPDIPMPSKGTL